MKSTRKVRKSLGKDQYKFHSVGKQLVKGRIKKTGNLLYKETGAMARVEGVTVEVESGRRRRKLPLAEKTYVRELFDILKPQSVFVLNELRKLGLSVIPTAWLALRESKWGGDVRQIMTDLKQDGRFKIVAYKFRGALLQEVKSLENLKEIQEQIEREERIAAKHGFQFKGGEWFIAIDPKTSTGKPYIVKGENVHLSKELWKRFIGWLKE